MKISTQVYREARRILGRPARVHYHHVDEEAIAAVLSAARKYGLSKPDGFERSRASLTSLSKEVVRLNEY